MDFMSRLQYIWDSHKEDCTHGMFEGHEMSLVDFVEEWSDDSGVLDQVMEAVETMADTFAEEDRKDWRVSLIVYKNSDGTVEFDYRTTREF